MSTPAVLKGDGASAGSGVLAIAALRLGAASAVGTDTDPLAVLSAAANARLNGVADAFQVRHCLQAGKVLLFEQCSLQW